MTSSAATVPSETDLLCEQCGYTLNGLPADGRCPECGTPVTLSLAQSGRSLPLWEQNRQFWATTRVVILRTGEFYRTLQTRVGEEQHALAYRFAMRHWFLGGMLLAIASGLHYSLTQMTQLPAAMEMRLVLLFLWIALVTGVAGFAAMGITHLATKLTAWEAGWRGYRLPEPVVLRGLCYHSAHLLPVAVVILGVVLGYRLLWMTQLVSYTSLVAYLIVLSVVSVGGAIYLFWTYWIGMRNMLYANI